MVDPDWHGKFNGVTFEFLCHAKHTVTGQEWLECYGGKRGYEAIMSFKLDGVQFARSKRS